ncbi:MAG: hypothetical protein JWN43_4829, partial [Gammaproteobacteria bacterium]|nr:hypothetical protein [Gammaproteobacteria bacterium]
AHQAEDRNEVEEHGDQLFTLTSFLPQTSHFPFAFSPISTSRRAFNNTAAAKRSR